MIKARRPQPPWRAPQVPRGTPFVLLALQRHPEGASLTHAVPGSPPAGLCCVWLGLMQGPLQGMSPGPAPISGHSGSLESESHGECGGVVSPPASGQCKRCTRYKSTQGRTVQVLSLALGEGIERTNKVGWGLHSLAPPFPPPVSF